MGMDETDDIVSTEQASSTVSLNVQSSKSSTQIYLYVIITYKSIYSWMGTI